MTGPMDKLPYERASLNLWNPSSAFCLAQLTNGFKQQSGSFTKVFPDVCLQRGQGESGERRRKKDTRQEEKIIRRER